MRKVLFISDIHIGLITDGFDRTVEIRAIFSQLFRHAKRLIKAGHDVDIVIGGDLFDKNNPSEKDIAFVMGIFNTLTSIAIKRLYVLAGNHESIYDGTRISCLSFLNKYSVKNKKVFVIEDIKMVCPLETDYGPFYYLFLPHITKFITKDNQGNPQEYLDKKITQIYNKLGKGVHSIAFTHLDVTKAKKGSETNSFRKVHTKIPESIYTGESLGTIPPVVLAGHIHTPKQFDNVNIVGSPLYTDFTDTDNYKYFAEVTIPSSMNTKTKVKYIRTNCHKFHLLDLDIVDKNISSLFELDEVKDFLKLLNEKCFVKFDIKMRPETAKTLDLRSFKNKLESKYGCIVKPIIPNVIHVRTVRSVKQSADLKAEQAIKVFLRNTNVKNKKSKFILAKEYIECL